MVKRLTAQDQDQEVKECAIFATGLVISILGDRLQSELPTSLNLLLDRLRNEITRLTAVKVCVRSKLSTLICLVSVRGCLRWGFLVCIIYILRIGL